MDPTWSFRRLLRVELTQMAREMEACHEHILPGFVPFLVALLFVTWRNLGHGVLRDIAWGEALRFGSDGFLPMSAKPWVYAEGS